MKKSQVIRPNSNHKNEIKNNQIYIPKVSNMIISEKIMQNLLRTTSAYLLAKNVPHLNLTPSRRNYRQSPMKNQIHGQQINSLHNQMNYVVTNSIRNYNPSNQCYLSSSFSKIPTTSGQIISQISTKTLTSINKQNQNSIPLYKLITKMKNQSKDTRSVSQFPTMSTERMVQDSEGQQQKRKKSVRFNDQVEYLVIKSADGIEKYKYKFFEPLDEDHVYL
ncbi:unnamed protein product (macronuclear) [Paramecium tetraurelia]|uniref:Uncharacterized protein n=1 Tax=Paramecium tetraurelia TaxID=5888 RepID=A0EHA3_PARTE|nr:uncharacterized protein GSPATT00027018001 [Paramecium tetraurelia]CAK94694.1 unnamed protein product [Paramecium tetraurelia]|eukprot:XP_001462067.1 hypothetical protein (macronuclear) [Paramecium tetraurelia strain d4-2]